jgi:sugar phosphate isomerase/epimerase
MNKPEGIAFDKESGRLAFEEGRTGHYRLGTTSFIYRDHVVPNVKRLAGRVQDVEILLFDVDEDLPGPEAVAELRALAEAHGLSYTVHTPLSASLASADEERRRRGVADVQRALSWAAPLEPLGFPVHVYLGEREHDPDPPRDLDAWRARATRSLTELIQSGVAAERLCVECLDYDFELIAPVVEALELSVALDIGHLERDGRALRALVTRYLDRARIIQWHGTDPGGRDHRSLTHFPRAEAEWLLETLRRRGWSGVLTLEVFNEQDFEESLARVRELAVKN